MVGDDNDFIFIPNFGVLTKLFFENADGSGTTDVVRHKGVDIYPDVFAGPDVRAVGCTGEDFFSESHWMGNFNGGGGGCASGRGYRAG